MKFSRRDFVAGVFALGTALTVAAPAFAQSAGKEFSPVTPPQTTEDPGKIEVLEFFSYGCPHCYEFYPQFSAWIAKQQPDVVVRKVPVSFNSYFKTLAPIYYALETMGELSRLDSAVFKAIHAEGNRLIDAKARAEWATKNGLDPKKFEDLCNSFSVSAKVRRAEQLSQAYKIQGVPAVAIDGKYMVNGKDHAETLAFADKIIAKVRAEKAGKK